ncbi:MAG: type II toxin-antitoxin system VapC family toxin [Pseudomonadota bacterium]
MIVVDTSAIMAILLDEVEAPDFHLILALETDVRLSAMTDFEARLLAFGRGRQRLVDDYNALFETAGFTVAPFAQDEALMAFEAYRRFGKGNHLARLNFGDCAAYALAKRLDAPLLFKGEDFARTDVRRAL